MERAGRYRTTYTISVPVCSSCRSQLNTRVALSWLAGVGIGLIVGGIATIFVLVRPHHDLVVLLVPLFIGLIAVFLGKLLVGFLVGLHFARIGGGGTRLYFSNPDYQAEFDRANGFR